jgi:hypothetical protein
LVITPKDPKPVTNKSFRNCILKQMRFNRWCPGDDNQLTITDQMMERCSLNYNLIINAAEILDVARSSDL